MSTTKKATKTTQKERTAREIVAGWGSPIRKATPEIPPTPKAAERPAIPGYDNDRALGFRVGHFARVRNTRATFKVTDVTDDGDTIHGHPRGPMAAALCERVIRTSGTNIPEMDRGTVAVKLRLPRVVADRFRELALKQATTLSDVVVQLLDVWDERALARAPSSPPIVEHGFALMNKRTGRVGSLHTTKGEARMLQSQDQKIRDRFRQASDGRAPRGDISVVPTISIRVDAPPPRRARKRTLAAVLAEQKATPKTPIEVLGMKVTPVPKSKPKSHGLKVHILEGTEAGGALVFACGRGAPVGSSQPYVGCARYKGCPGQSRAELDALRAQVTCAGCRKRYERTLLDVLMGEKKTAR